MLELDELAAHPLHVAREVFFTLDGGALGPIAQLRTPLGTPTAPRLPPTLGAHSREVLAEYGLPADEITAVCG